jgi:hypothetical protein
MTERLQEIGLDSPDESIAKAIDRLSTDEKIKLMSNIHDRKDVDRLILMYDVAETLGLPWLSKMADNKLCLYVSCDKGRGRMDVVNVARRPQEGGGMFGGLREKISSFIRSE